jgi:hypothetical protein
MAITSLGGAPAIFPNMPVSSQAPGPTANTSTLSLNAATRIKFGIVVQVPKTGTLDGIELYSGFVSSPSAITASFQNVNASGFPDGTQDQYRSLASPASGWNVWGSMTDTGADGGNKRSVTQGDWIGIVLEWTSTQSGQFWHYSLPNNGSAWQMGQRWVTDTGAGFTATGDAHFINIVLRYDDSTYARVGSPHTCWPFVSASTHTFNSGSTPDERGIKWTPPVTVEVSGVWVNLAASAACDVVLYDSGGTALQTITLDPDYPRSTAEMFTFLMFGTVQTLTAGQVYRLTVKPTSVSNVSVYSWAVNAAAILEAIEGGSAMHGTSRTDAGAFSDTTTQRYMMGFLVSGVDTGGSGGASSYPFVG